VSRHRRPATVWTLEVKLMSWTLAVLIVCWLLSWL